MNKGLLIYPIEKCRKCNIGDYIQSIAARQFIGDKYEFIDRESMNKERTDDVALIANGWYMHHPENWPPDPKIHPLFVALHINKLVEDTLLSPPNIPYFKAHEPIGCRDCYTTEKLRKKGINAYFSGCLTLTLGQSYKHKETEEAPVYFTDVDSLMPLSMWFKLKCIYALLTKSALLKKIQHRLNKFGIKRSLKWISGFYTTYSDVIEDDLFINAEYIEHEINNVFESEDKKFEYADRLLKRYENARFVVTSRIHCALPCLAMGTPVLYVDNLTLGEVHNCRLDGLRQLFNTIRITNKEVSCDLLKDGTKLTKKSIFTNKEDYRLLCDNIIAKCTEFIGTLK